MLSKQCFIRNQFSNKVMLSKQCVIRNQLEIYPGFKCILCLAWFSESCVSSGNIVWHDDASHSIAWNSLIFSDNCLTYWYTCTLSLINT